MVTLLTTDKQVPAIIQDNRDWKFGFQINRLVGPMLLIQDLLSIEPWAAAKKLLASVAVPPVPVRVPSQRPLVPSVTPVANDKGNNEMILGAVHRSPSICLTAEENPRRSQLGDCLMKGLCDQPLFSKWGRWDRTGRQEERGKERRKERQEN